MLYNFSYVSMLFSRGPNEGGGDLALFEQYFNSMKFHWFWCQFYINSMSHFSLGSCKLLWTMDSMDYHFVSTVCTTFIWSKCCHNVTTLERHIGLRNDKDLNFKIFCRFQQQIPSQTHTNAYILILPLMKKIQDLGVYQKSNYI